MGLFSRAVDRMVSEKVPRKRRRRMIVFVAILTLLSMVTSTVAWFSVNTFAGVDKIDVHISVAAQLRVSMEDHGSDINAYVKTITNEMVDTYLARQNTRLSEIVLDPVTTANGTTFTNQRGVQREPNKKSYLEFECYFIATEPMWVHLTTESSQTIEGDNGTRVTSTSPAPQNEVVQCTRVAAKAPEITNVQVKGTDFDFDDPSSNTFDIYYLQPLVAKATANTFTQLSYTDAVNTQPSASSGTAVTLAARSDKEPDDREGTDTYTLTVTATNCPPGIAAADAKTDQKTYTIRVSFNAAQKVHYDLVQLYDRCLQEADLDTSYFEANAPLAAYRTAYSAARTEIGTSLRITTPPTATISLMKPWKADTIPRSKTLPTPRPSRCRPEQRNTAI